MITHTDIRKIFKVSQRTSTIWMQNNAAPITRKYVGMKDGKFEGGSGISVLALDGVIAGVRTKKHKNGPMTPEETQALVRANSKETFDPNHRFENPIARQQQLERVLTGDEKERLQRSRERFYSAMQRIWFQQSRELNPAVMLKICILNPRILHYVLTGERDSIYTSADAMAALVAGFVSNNNPVSATDLLNEHRGSLAKSLEHRKEIVDLKNSLKQIEEFKRQYSNQIEALKNQITTQKELLNEMQKQKRHWFSEFVEPQKGIERLIKKYNKKHSEDIEQREDEYGQ